MDFRPKLIICRGSAYPKDWDYVRFRSNVDKAGVLLLMTWLTSVALWLLRHPTKQCDGNTWNNRGVCSSSSSMQIWTKRIGAASEITKDLEEMALVLSQTTS